MADETWSDEDFRKAYQAQADEIGHFNLAVFGKTGVGKSTLINAVFGEEVAPTGIGEPVTHEAHLYLHRTGFLGLLDTQGLEIGKDSETLIAELGEYIQRIRQKPLSEQVHLAWYCVRATDRRFEDTEAEFVRRLHELRLPVIVVLTQVPARDGEYHLDAVALAEHIAALKLPIAGGRPILVMAKEDGFAGMAQHGLEELLDATFRAAPEGVGAALAAAQKIDLARKRVRARKVVQATAGIATGVGAAPIPFADAAVLVPIQLGMMAKVAAVYGVNIGTASIASTVVTTLLTAAGKSAVVGLLKLIPGAGFLVGGVISASVAGTFTLATGYAWAMVCGELTQGRLKGADGALDNEQIKKIFQEQFTHWFEKVRGSKTELAHVKSNGTDTNG